MKVVVGPVANAGVSFAGVTERAAAARRQAAPRCVPRLMLTLPAWTLGLHAVVSLDACAYLS